MEGPAVTLPRRRDRLERSIRSGHNWKQLGKFAVVGAVGYLINLAIDHTLLDRGWHYLAAAAISFLVAATSNYTWNRLWTFRDQRGHIGAQGIRFFVVSLAALGGSLLLNYVLVHTTGMAKFWANAIAIVLVTPLNFIGNKLWSFRRHKN